MPASDPSTNGSQWTAVLACLVAAAGLLVLVDVTTVNWLGLARTQAFLSATHELGHLPPSLKFLSADSVRVAAASLATKVADATLVPNALVKTLLGLNGVLLLLTLAQALFARRQRRASKRETLAPENPIKKPVQEKLVDRPDFPQTLQDITQATDRLCQLLAHDDTVAGPPSAAAASPENASKPQTKANHAGEIDEQEKAADTPRFLLEDAGEARTTSQTLLAGINATESVLLDGAKSLAVLRHQCQEHANLVGMTQRDVHELASQVLELRHLQEKATAAEATLKQTTHGARRHLTDARRLEGVLQKQAELIHKSLPELGGYSRAGDALLNDLRAQAEVCKQGVAYATDMVMTLSTRTRDLVDAVHGASEFVEQASLLARKTAAQAAEADASDAGLASAEELRQLSSGAATVIKPLADLALVLRREAEQAAAGLGQGRAAAVRCADALAAASGKYGAGLASLATAVDQIANLTGSVSPLLQSVAGALGEGRALDVAMTENSKALAACTAAVSEVNAGVQQTLEQTDRVHQVLSHQAMGLGHAEQQLGGCMNLLRGLGHHAERHVTTTAAIDGAIRAMNVLTPLAQGPGVDGEPALVEAHLCLRILKQSVRTLSRDVANPPLDSAQDLDTTPVVDVQTAVEEDKTVVFIDQRDADDRRRA